MTDIVPTDGKQTYYARREAQERALAERTADPSARRAHDELASRYAALAAESVELRLETA